MYKEHIFHGGDKKNKGSIVDLHVQLTIQFMD